MESSKHRTLVVAEKRKKSKKIKKTKVLDELQTLAGHLASMIWA